MKTVAKTQRPASTSHVPLPTSFITVTVNRVVSQRISPPFILAWVELESLGESTRLSRAQINDLVA